MKENKNNKIANKKETNKTKNKSEFTVTGTEKKKKLSTKGKKNWRKNIDVTEFDKKALKKLDDNIVKTNAKFMKDEDFFTLDVKPIESARQKLLREKSEKKKKVKKLSIFEDRKIRRMIKNKEKIKNEKTTTNHQNNSLLNNNIKPEEKEKVYDLWGNDINSKSESIFKFPNSSLNQNKNIVYPKLPLPHPGQSYNPAEKDIKQLLNKVVETNKHLVKNSSEELNELEPVQLYESSDSENEEILDFKISNNPAVDDNERKTKKEKKRLIQKKLNLIKEKEKVLKKQKKKEISTALGLKRLEKKQKQFLKELEEKKLKDIQEKKEKEKLIKLGLIEEYKIFYLKYKINLFFKYR